MNVLLVGSGGREHALAWCLAASPLLETLYCAPGNPGIAAHATCVELDIGDHDAIARFCTQHAVELVVIGPEAPLVAGLVDDLLAAGIKAFGPSSAAAQLEGSKGFTKDLCRQAGIPTAAYQRFRDLSAAKAYAAQQTLPLVVKADGLAAGKGVVIAETAEAVDAAIDACFSGQFGAAGEEVVLEAYLEGEEASFFALVDGTHAVPLATAQDHKRIGEDDTGPNTGGMGAYSPASIVTEQMSRRIMTEIIEPTVRTMASRGTPYVGVLYAGLMLTQEGPQLIEYNVRLGDPEAQVLMVRLTSDLLPALLATCDGSLDRFDLQWSDDVALTVVMSAPGYPGTPETGSEIRRLEQAAQCDGVEIFQAGTRADGDRLVAAGGRVLNVTARGATIEQARQRAYAAIDVIDWPQGYCRRDIGWREIERGRTSDAG